MRKPRPFGPAAQSSCPMAVLGHSRPDSLRTTAGLPFGSYACRILYGPVRPRRNFRLAICRDICPRRSVVFLGHASGRLSLDYPPLTDTEVGLVQWSQFSMKPRFSNSKTRAVLPVAVAALSHEETADVILRIAPRNKCVCLI